MPNRLAQETSPYLLQHAGNPVEWYPWGEEALQRARQEQKPIFLSIGYAACHWCHVMAHESFEDEETAGILNQHFINIKVDREERPDLDSIYMAAVQALTGQGGWPMSVFTTPEGEPFYAGTYFPDRPRYGMPSFRQVLLSVSDAWQNRRQRLLQGAQEVTRHIGRTLDLGGNGQSLDLALFDRALEQVSRAYDPVHGGFGPAPKFPQAMTIEFLLRHHHQTGQPEALAMARHSLEQMARGGMYDQLGGGFARYATDARWLVPHFEKMLYDNALLARVYLHAWQVSGTPLFRRVVEETLDWAVAEMRHESGGFFSSMDADSEGEEGKFYVWQPAEIRAELGEEADLFLLAYGVSERGNWEGRNILHLPRSLAEVASLAQIDEATAAARLRAARRKLYAVRSRRVWPGLDDKVLAAWNGLMLAAFAEAGFVLRRPDYLKVAWQNADFLRANLRRGDGRLFRTWKAGSPARIAAYLEDYAYLADGLLALFQATGEAGWFDWARELAGLMLAHFRDDGGGFYDTADDHEGLIHRPKDLQDNAVPSGNAMAAQVLLKLGLYTGDATYWDAAEQALRGLYGPMAQAPTAFAHWLGAAWFALAEPREIAIIGEWEDAGTQALLEPLLRAYRPHQVVAVGQEGSGLPLLAGRRQLDGKATAYVCRHFTCLQPVTTLPDLLAQLGGSSPPPPP